MRFNYIMPFNQLCLEKNIRYDYLSLLIKYGTNINAVQLFEINNKIWYTPLYIACKKNNFKLVKFLIENGANIDIYHPILKTTNPDIIKYMIENGADINFIKEVKYYICNDCGYTLYHKAAVSNNIELMEYLLENCSIDINLENKNQESALIIAGNNNNYKMIKNILVKKNGQILIDHFKRLFFNACANGYIKIVKLFSYSSNLFDFRIDNLTPLYIAARENHFNIVKFLINIGVTLDIYKSYNISYQVGNKLIFEYFESYIAENKKYNLNQIRKILENTKVTMFATKIIAQYFSNENKIIL